MPVQFTTDLPDSSGLLLDASEQGEITATWDDTINNGEFRIEWKEEEPDTDTSYSDTNSATVDEATTAYTITDLLDGEKYSIRLRTQTAHKTGSWLEAADITKLTAADQPIIASSSDSSVSFDWTVNSDFEGSQQIYRRRTDYSYDDDGRLVDSLSTTANSYTDSTAQPDREYDYMVRAVTQWVQADSPTSDPVTTDSIGLDDRPVPPQGWYAEVDTPSGTVREVPIADGAQWRPRINGLPRVSLPVPKNDVWRDLDGQPLRVWYDGRRLPIDELETITSEEGQMVLEGRGGLQLRRRVVAEYSSRAAHEAVQDLIQNETDYAANVDAPDPDPITDEVMQAADTTGELQDTLESRNADMPFDVSNGEAPVLQTAINERGLDRDRSSSTSFINADRYIDGDALYFGGSSGYAEWDVSFSYDIPADRVGIATRDETINTSDITWKFNGESIDRNTASGTSLGWTNIGAGAYSGNGYNGGGLDAGTTYTLRAEANGSSEYAVDAVAVFDKAYYPKVNDWGNEGWDSLHEPGGHLDGPPFYPPDGAQIRTLDVETPYSVIAARLETVINDTSGPQKLEVSNDQGESWLEATNTQTLDQEFPGDGGTLRARFTLGGYGTRDNATPRKGFNAQSLDSFDLFADLSDTPVLVNRTFEGDLIDVLAEIANDTDSITEVRRDGGSYSVEWTRAGQRTSDRSLEVTSYSDRKTIEDKTLACEVVGGRQTVSGERFTPPDTSTDVSLSNSGLITGTEYVFDPTDNTAFVRGDDYVIGNREGTIRIKDGGNMSADTTYAIDYEYKPRGRHEDESWDGDATTERTEEIPSLTTTRGCQQAALRIVQETSTPLNEVEIGFTDIDPNQPLVEAINLDVLPGDEYYEARELDFQDGQGTGTFADRQTVGGVIDGIRSRIDAIARRS